MNSFRFTMLLGACAVGVGLRADPESNLWPGPVSQLNPAGDTLSWSALGPFLFEKPDPEGGIDSGFRPLWVINKDTHGDTKSLYILYPLFWYRSYPDATTWSVFELINKTDKRPGAQGAEAVDNTFDVWPFYFSKAARDPADSYKAVFPIEGTVYNFLGFDRISWTLFPVYAQIEHKKTVQTDFLWPFFRKYTGARTGGAFWPVYGSTQGPGDSHDWYALWPLIYDHYVAPPDDAAPGTPPHEQSGFLPFFTKETGPGLDERAYLWPFFGYEDRTIPDQYHESRYFWPLFVQGQGATKTVDRWAPFYTHSWSAKGTDRTWILWPLWKDEKWNEGSVAVDHQSIFYFFYLNIHQTSLNNPNAAPAYKRSVWPLFTTWDNGRGHTQFQLLSPFEPVFTTNEKMRTVWTPITALVRSDHQAGGASRTSVLWDALDWTKDEKVDRSTFHLGPLFATEHQAGASRYSFFNGLFGFRKGSADSHWSSFWCDFPSKRAKTNTLDQP